MEKFDVSKLTVELQNEIKACKSTEELKALFVSKNYYVPDSKLEPIMKLIAKSDALDLDELDMVSGGGCSCSPHCDYDCSEDCLNLT